MGHSREEDDNRLPDGMVLTGYDADSGRRYYLDSNDGSTWMGAPYVRYGTLTRIETPTNPEGSDEENNEESDVEEYGYFDDNKDDDDDAEAQDALSETATKVPDDRDRQSIESSATTLTTTTSRPRAGSVTPTQLEHDSELPLPESNVDTISVDDLPVYAPAESMKSEPPYEAGIKDSVSNPDAKVAVTLAEPAPNDAKWKRPMLRQITRFIMATKRKMDHGFSNVGVAE